MKKFLAGFFFGLVGLVLAGGGLQAQDTQDLRIQVVLAGWYDLAIGTSQITFADKAPEFGATPPTVSLSAAENPVSVRAFAIVSPSDRLQLSVSSPDDLADGKTTIGIGAISWTVASGAGYVPGTMNKATPQVVGSWSGGQILHWHEGTLNFSFARDYTTQAPGTYNATVTYTLSSI